MLALITHDNKKDDLMELAARRRNLLSRFALIATGTTGGLVSQATGLDVLRVQSGPLGGDAQIAARVAQDEVRAVIFIVDPLFAHPHEPDVQGLVRICNVHNVPLALNIATAEMLLDALELEEG
jgi:methylglyoxal synthase